jgi:hypothetical protein
MASFNLDNYETVEDRLVKFWDEHKMGRILTSVHYYDESRILVRAEIYFNREDDRPVATGYAEELRGASPVNRTSHAENAETSAIGRGLANCGYAAKGSRPSREEMEKVQRMGSTPAPSKPVDNRSTDQIINGLMDTFGAEKVDRPTSAPASTPMIKNPGEAASEKQVNMIRAILSGQGIKGQEVLDLCGATIGRELDSFDTLTKGEASTLITKFK